MQHNVATQQTVRNFKKSIKSKYIIKYNSECTKVAKNWDVKTKKSKILQYKYIFDWFYLWFILVTYIY